MLAKMLRKIMKERHLTQTALAKQIGVTRPSISYWLNGSVPTGENLEKLCKFLNVEPSFLQYGVSRTENDETTIVTPAMDRQATPSANITEGNRGVLAMRFSKEWLNSRSTAILDTIRLYNVTGSTMSPTFDEGDLLVVDTSIKQVTSNGIYIIRQLEEDVVRRIQLDLDQTTVHVIFDNDQYQNFSTDDSERLEIVGKVIFAYKRVTNF